MKKIDFAQNLRVLMAMADIKSDKLADELTSIGHPVQGQTIRRWIKGTGVPGDLTTVTPALVEAISPLVNLPKSKVHQELLKYDYND